MRLRHILTESQFDSASEQYVADLLHQRASFLSHNNVFHLSLSNARGLAV